MKAYSLSARSRSRGITMFEVTIAISIAALALAASLPYQLERTETIQAEVTASQLFTLGDVAQQYRLDNGVWPGQASNCAFNDVMTDLLALNYLTVAPRGTAWALLPDPIDPLLTNDGPLALSTVCTPALFTVGAAAPNLDRAGQAASLLHTARVAPISAPQVGYTHEVFSDFPAGGAPAFAQVLHRVVIPGRPELNRMETDIDMNANSIVNADQVEADGGDFDTLDVSGNSTLCSGGAANCRVTVNPNGRFQNTGGANVQFRLLNEGQLIVDSPAGSGDLTVTGTLRANNEQILAAQGLQWGNGSRLATGGSDVIELGGNDGVAGNGTPSLDFHFNGLTEDFNVRFINSSNRVMTLRGAGGNLATMIVEGDGIYTNNLQVVGNIGVRDVVSSVSNKSLSQAVQTMTIVEAGTSLPIPSYCATFGLVPQIYTAVNQTAEGPTSCPIYQSASYATVSGGNWNVHMKLVTECGVYDSGAGSMPAASRPFNQVLVAIKCEAV